MDEHEKWLSRRVYHETFSTPGAEFPSWRGIPNRCNCGCAEVWYDRLSPTNWWATFNPARYISTFRGVVRVFLALHRVLWRLPPVIWIWLQMVRAGYKREVTNRIQPGASASIAMATARLLLYGIIVPLTIVVWATVWVLSRPGVILLIALCAIPDTSTSCGCTLDCPNNIGNRHLDERPCLHNRRLRVHFILRQSCRRYHSYRDWRVCAI